MINKFVLHISNELNLFFYGTPIWFWSSIFISIVLAISIAVSWLCNNFASESFKYDPDTAIGILGITGTIYAVMLAMIAVDVVSEYHQAEVSIVYESGYIGNIFRASQHLPPDAAIEVSNKVKSYLITVLNKEIPSQDLNHFQISNLKGLGYQDLDKIWGIVLKANAPDILNKRLAQSRFF